MNSIYYNYICFNILECFRNLSKNVANKYGIDEKSGRLVCLFRERSDGKVDIYVRCYCVKDLSKSEAYLYDTYTFPIRADLVYKDEAILGYVGLDISFIDMLLGYFKIISPNGTGNEIDALYFSRGLLMDRNLKHFIEFESIRYKYINILKATGIGPKLSILSIEEEAFIVYYMDKTEAIKAKGVLSKYFDEIVEVYLKGNTNPYRLTCKMPIERMSDEFMQMYVNNFKILFFDGTDRQRKQRAERFIDYVNSLGITENIVKSM